MSDKGIAYKWIKEKKVEHRTQTDRLYLKLREAEGPLARFYATYRWKLYCQWSGWPILVRYKRALQETLGELRGKT